MKKSDMDLLKTLRQEFYQNYKDLKRLDYLPDYFENDDCDEDFDVNRLRLDTHT